MLVLIWTIDVYLKIFLGSNYLRAIPIYFNAIWLHKQNSCFSDWLKMIIIYETGTCSRRPCCRSTFSQVVSWYDKSLPGRSLPGRSLPQQKYERFTHQFLASMMCFETFASSGSLRSFERCWGCWWGGGDVVKTIETWKHVSYY